MPGTPRTTATDSTARWDSSRTVTRGVSSSVAERRARALGKEGTRRPSQSSDPSELPGNIFGILWIALGALIVVLCLVFVVGSIVMFGVLREISDARNYDSAAMQVSG